MKKIEVAKTVSASLGITAGLDYLAASLITVIPRTIEQLKLPGSTEELNFALYKDIVLHPLNTFEHALQFEPFQHMQWAAGGLFLASTLKKLWDKRNLKTEDASKYGSHGTSRWATKKEIFNRKDIIKKLNNEGTILAKYKNDPIILKDESWKNKNIFIIGGSGAGKSKSFVMTNIINTTDKSIVVTDPKGELYESTSEAKRKQGYKVRLLNFIDLEVSDRYNPFDYIKKETDALRVAKAIIMNSGGNAKQMKGDFWDKAEIALLSAFILYIKYNRPEEEHHFGSVFNLGTQSYQDVHLLFKELDKDNIAYRAYAQAIEKLDDKVRANVFISLLVSLDLWKYQSVCEFTAKSDFLLSDIAKEKTIVYVMIPIAEEEFRPLISTLFTQLFTELYDVANKNFNKLPVKVKIICDEFNNIGKFPNFTERLSTTRSYGIEVFPIVQSIGQMKDRWGPDQMDEIIDNCDTTLYLGSNSLSSKEYFSKLLGTTTIKIQGDSESKNDSGASESKSHSVTGRSLLTPDELGRLDDNQALIFMKGKYPMLVNKAWIHEMPILQDQMKETVSRFDFPAAERNGYTVFDPGPELEIIYAKIAEAQALEKELAKQIKKAEKMASNAAKGGDIKEKSLSQRLKKPSGSLTAAAATEDNSFLDLENL